MPMGIKLISVYTGGTYGHTIEVPAYGTRGRARDIQTVAERERAGRASSSKYWTASRVSSRVSSRVASRVATLIRVGICVELVLCMIVFPSKMK